MGLGKTLLLHVGCAYTFGQMDYWSCIACAMVVCVCVCVCLWIWKACGKQSHPATGSFGTKTVKTISLS